MAEDLAYQYKDKLPIAIGRPSISMQISHQWSLLNLFLIYCNLNIFSYNVLEGTTNWIHRGIAWY
jgi:hypothetical protein